MPRNSEVSRSGPSSAIIIPSISAALPSLAGGTEDARGQGSLASGTENTCGQGSLAGGTADACGITTPPSCALVIPAGPPSYSTCPSSYALLRRAIRDEPATQPSSAPSPVDNPSADDPRTGRSLAPAVHS
eukprot:1223674-Pyramimonas_sp.AAC.1